MKRMSMTHCTARFLLNQVACRHGQRQLHLHGFVALRTSSFSTAVSPPSSQTVATTATKPSEKRKMTSLELLHLKRKGIKIAMITAYDYPSGRHAEMSDMDIVLVGDSVGMVVLGYSTTQPVTMEDIERVRCVDTRGVRFAQQKDGLAAQIILQRFLNKTRQQQPQQQ